MCCDGLYVAFGSCSHNERKCCKGFMVFLLIYGAALMIAGGCAMAYGNTQYQLGTYGLVLLIIGSVVFGLVMCYLFGMCISFTVHYCKRRNAYNIIDEPGPEASVRYYSQIVP